MVIAKGYLFFYTKVYPILPLIKFMYIRKTKTRSINNADHYSYRLVESRRDSNGKVKQHTFLNLGAHYNIVAETDHPLLSQRIENIIIGQQSLLPLTDDLETEAQRIDIAKSI